MRRHLMLAALLGLAVMALSAPAASAQNCNSAPTGYGGAWWKSYSAWCSACGGTPNPAKTSCTPGPNWGRRGGDQAPDNSAAEAAAANAEAEAEAERQQEIDAQNAAIEEQNRQAAAQAQREKEEFERNKQQALRDMRTTPGGSDLQSAQDEISGLKGTEEDSFGLKDSLDSPEGGLGLKDDSNSSAQPSPNSSKAKTAQITMRNNTPTWLYLYIDGEFGCGPVMPRKIGATGGFCTSSTTPGTHRLEARKSSDSPKAERTAPMTIRDGSSPTWEVDSNDK